MDLGSVQNLSSVQLTWEAAYGRSYRIQTSANGSTWADVGGISTTGDGGTDTLAVSGSGRYVQVYGTARGTAWGYSLWEFKVFGGAPPTSPSPQSLAQPSPSPSPGTFAANRYPQSNGTLPGTTGSASTVTLAAANGNRDGVPTNAAVYNATGLTAAYSGAATTFDLFVDAGTNVGNATQVRVSYDLTGNGSWDRVETYTYFATDPVGGWEHYTQAAGVKSATGALGNLANGSVRVEVWSAIGSTTTNIGIGNQSVIRLPFA